MPDVDAQRAITLHGQDAPMIVVEKIAAAITDGDDGEVAWLDSVLQRIDTLLGIEHP